MCSATLNVLYVSMATTQVTRAESYETVRPLVQPHSSQRRHPIMNWVVVTDKPGMQRLRMQWCMAASNS